VKTSSLTKIKLFRNPKKRKARLTKGCRVSDDDDDESAE
jgi:hypothetical protein